MSEILEHRANPRIVKYFRKYQAKWPEYCQKCGATGVKKSYDSVPVPFGIGNCLMESCEPCEGCSEQGLCPRCKVPIGPDDVVMEWFENMEPCPQCGWRWGEKPGDCQAEIDP